MTESLKIHKDCMDICTSGGVGCRNAWGTSPSDEKVVVMGWKAENQYIF